MHSTSTSRHQDDQYGGLAPGGVHPPGSSNVEFIGSFTKMGVDRTPPDAKVYGTSRMPEQHTLRLHFNMSERHTLRLKSFDAARDSGLYGCASVVGSELIFGKVTRLIGTAKAPLVCAPLVLWPLVGGCGLLLLVLLSTIVYCTRIRTRR
ncbi:hypothetical protein NHX12_029854 [Muraenolepis orangiensis]|uniref:Uncharacterized protein n=1 Tax=Muraenolepis orangiensis TaxID=630683 RepID=A0A9Q0IL64_9TELE|nr:hypothetical protein NHX12_029854 [Muraenolepis orangiensis]